MRRSFVLFGLLALVLIAAFTVYAVETSTWGKIKAAFNGETASPLASGSDPIGPEGLTSLAKQGGTPGPPDEGDGGGQKRATFEVTFTGKVTGTPASEPPDIEGTIEVTAKISENTSSIGTFGVDPWLTLSSSFGECFGETFPGAVIIGTIKKNQPPGAWFAFKGVATDGETPVDYSLHTFGTLGGTAFPPTQEDPTHTITLTSWRFGVQGQESGNACTESGDFQSGTTIEVTWLSSTP